MDLFEQKEHFTRMSKLYYKLGLISQAKTNVLKKLNIINRILEEES